MFRILKIIVFVVCLNPIKVKGQNVCSFTHEEYNAIACLNGYANYQDNLNASLVVQNILSKLNLKNSFFITKVCYGINNAIAINYKNTKYILLDIAWMDNLKYGKEDWFHFFVIGHEISHHLLGHTLTQVKNNVESRKRELEADELAGYILGMYGVSKEDIDVLLFNFPDEAKSNSTHPPKADRIKALQKGYNSSKKNEIIALVQSITKDADLNLSSIPYLLNSAHLSWNNYLEHFSKSDLEKTISLYQQVIRFNDDPQLIYELGNLLLSNNENEKYISSLELAYTKSKDVKYLPELISHLVSTKHSSLTNYIKKYESLINKIKLDEISDAYQAVHLSKYFGYKARLNIETTGVDTFYINKGNNASQHAIKLIQNKNIKNSESHRIIAEALNALGLSNLWLLKYFKANQYFNQALTEFYEAEKTGTTSLEKAYSYYSLNKLAVLNNISLSNLRLRHWDDCLKYSIEYENFVNALTSEKRTYLNSMGAINLNDIYYYKARGHHGLENFNEAIKFFNLAIENKPDDSSFLYFYRALSYLGLNKDVEACTDFQKACKAGISDACTRYSSTCK